MTLQMMPLALSLHSLTYYPVTRPVLPSHISHSSVTSPTLQMPRQPSPSQPPAGSQAERAQIAASNQTVNSFLGASRLPWMTDTQPPAATPDAASVIPEHRPARRGRPPKKLPPKTTHGPVHADKQPQPHPARPTAELPSPALTNEPSPAASGPPAGLLAFGPSVTVQPPHPVSGSPHVWASELASADQGGAQERPQGAVPPGQTSADPGLTASLTPTTSRSSSTDAKRKAAAAEPSQSWNIPHPGPPGHGEKRPRMDEGGRSSSQLGELTNAVMGGWSRLLDRQIQQHGGLGALEKDLQKPRYLMLRDACAKRDLYYVLVHQQFCLWSIDKDAVHRRLNLPPQTIDSAFESLLIVLRRNQDLPQKHLRWLAQFPSPLAQIAQLFAPYHDVVSQIGRFIHDFSRQWIPLSDRAEARGYPLLAFESQLFLSCPSATLQPVFFTLTRRRLRIPDGPVADSLFAIFKNDQQNELRMVREGVPEVDVTRSRAHTVHQYKTIMTPATVRLSDQATATTPLVAGRGNSQLEMHPAGGSGSSTLPNPPHQSRPQPQQAPSTHQTWSGPPQQQLEGRGSFAMGVDPALVLRSNEQRSAFNTVSQGPGLGFTIAGNSFGQGQGLESIQPRSPRPPGVEAAAPGARSFSQEIHPQQWAFAQRLQTASPQNAQMAGMGSPFRTQSSTGPPQASQQPQQCHQLRLVAAGPRNHPMAHASSQVAMQQSPQQQPNGALPQRRGSGRPALPSAQYASPQASPRLEPPRLRRIPENEYPVNAYDWTSVQPSLHLVHLRSPKRAAMVPTASRYYQFVSRFSVPPKAFPPQTGLRCLEFSMSETEKSRLYLTSTFQGLPSSLFRDGSTRYRLRMGALKEQGATEIKETQWAALPTEWPEHIHVQVNEQAVFPRRKQHFHHDFPIELSDLVILGRNTIKVSFPEVAMNLRKGMSYFLAVEIVTVMGHDSVKVLVGNAGHISADVTRQEVARRQQTLGRDDDVVVENDGLCVRVADPFSSALFEVPVRGVDCKHLECFDLETWLITRPKKSKTEEEPTLVDAWRCPICNADARPVSLQVDDFFLRVRQDLVNSGKARTKTINIQADGSWTPVEEDEEDEEDEPPEGRWQPAGQASRRASRAAIPETIEILDD